MLLIVFCCIVYAFDYQKPDWCSFVSRYNGYYRFIVNEDLEYLFDTASGTAADSTYISSAFEYFTINENALHASSEGSSGSNIYSQIDFTADNVVFFDYYYTTSSGGNSHYYYYFVPEDENISKDDLFYYVSPPKGSGSSSSGFVWSKTTQRMVKGTYYRGQASYDKNVENAYLYIYYNCAGPSSIPYGGTFDIESNIACYMTSDSLEDVLNGNVNPDNAEDLLPKRYGVLEVPQNIRYNGKKSYGITANKENLFNADNIEITWTQSDPNYKLWSTEILIYGDMGVKWLVELFSSYERVYEIFLYSTEFPTSELSFTIDIEDMIKKNPIWLNKIHEILDSGSGLYSDKIYGISLMIRNKYFDGEYTYYSNWVELYFDDEGNVGSVSNEGSGSNTEYDYDDPIHGDDNMDFTQNKPTGNINPDSPYQGDKINPSTDFSITDFVTNGFGLAGEGGVIDMFKDLFSFIPAPVWTLILTGISVLIAIALLKAVL